ncbi:IS66 family transposase [Streptomyces sp. NPDC005393]|uniref:IS66 family transposase n=1 Tax=Streptomyces sp. NPDC005393 TaxID=3157041 RepID=UPI0033B6AFEC
MSPQPSYEDLAALVAVQARVIDELRVENAELRARVADLERRLGTDSTNSSKPPSSDPLEKKATRSQRERSKDRKPGGQPGRAGRSLQLVAVPDRVERVEPAECARCSCPLSGAVQEGFRAVQVFDIPLIEREVTEVRLIRRRCGCGAVTCGDASPGVSGPVCYGPNLRAFATLLAAEGQISTERTAKLMAGLLDVEVSTGFVDRCLSRLDAPLGQFEAGLKQELRRSPVLGADETPISLAGERGYAYTIRSAGLTWYGAADNRGHAALDGFGILPGYRGVLIRDDYVGYHKYNAHLAGVQLCCAHLLRDLQGVIDNAPDEEHAAWAQAAQQVLREAGQSVEQAHAAGEGMVPEHERARIEGEFLTAARCGISVNPHHGGKKSKARQLAERLIDKTPQVLRFTWDFTPGLTWTNNASEQALRDIKVKMKVSGCWRGLAGARRYLRIRSYLTTARAHGLTAMRAIRDALIGTPWLAVATA